MKRTKRTFSRGFSSPGLCSCVSVLSFLERRFRSSRSRPPRPPIRISWPIRSTTARCSISTASMSASRRAACGSGLRRRALSRATSAAWPAPTSRSTTRSSPASSSRPMRIIDMTGVRGWDALFLGHFGGFVTNSAIIYAAAGAGTTDTTWSMPSAAGVEAAVADQISARARGPRPRALGRDADRARRRRSASSGTSTSRLAGSERPVQLPAFAWHIAEQLCSCFLFLETTRGWAKPDARILRRSGGP